MNIDQIKQKIKEGIITSVVIAGGATLQVTANVDFGSEHLQKVSNDTIKIIENYVKTKSKINDRIRGNTLYID